MAGCLYSSYWGWLCSNRSSCSLSPANAAAEHAGCPQCLGWQRGLLSAGIQKNAIVWSRRTHQRSLLGGRMKWDRCKYYYFFIRIRSRNYSPLSLLKLSQRNFSLYLNSITENDTAYLETCAPLCCGCPLTQTDFKQHYGNSKRVSPQGLCLLTCKAAKTIKLTPEKKNPA